MSPVGASSSRSFHSAWGTVLGEGAPVEAREVLRLWCFGVHVRHCSTGLPLEFSAPRSASYLVLERAWPGFNTVCARHYLPTPRHKISSSICPTSRAGITLLSLKSRRSSARNDAGRSAICLSSNRHDRGNEQQTSGRARLAGRGAVSARGRKSKSSTRSDSPIQNDSKSIDRFFVIPAKVGILTVKLPRLALDPRPLILISVVPTKAGTQGFQSLAPGSPLSRGRRVGPSGQFSDTHDAAGAAFCRSGKVAENARNQYLRNDGSRPFAGMTPAAGIEMDPGPFGTDGLTSLGIRRPSSDQARHSGFCYAVDCRLRKTGIRDG